MAVDTKTIPEPDATSSFSVNAQKYLSFHLGQEEFGVAILRVREIIGMMDITPLPHTPEYVRGVINLRGRIIPIIELRRRFELEPAAFDRETCIIVVEVSGSEDDTRCVGVIVDRVREVVTVPDAQIDAAPNFGDTANTEYILGMAKLEDRVVTLIDADHAFGELIIDIDDTQRDAAAETAQGTRH